MVQAHSKLFKILSLLLVIVMVMSGCQYKTKKHDGWEIYRGSEEASQFSDLNQIDTVNVHQLRPAWTFHTGDAGQRTTIECNPIIIKDRIYITSPSMHLIALNASTGKELWRFKPYGHDIAAGINRGVTYWKDKTEEYIFFPAGSYLYAVNALTGSLYNHFGHQGKIDLRDHLGRDTAKTSISLTTPGIIYQDLLIIGSATGEGYEASPGHIRAYNARDGSFKWIFHTIPEQGEVGYETWQRSTDENYGGTNNWGGLSLDIQKGIVFVATGSPTYDFYGANRKGANLFANCIIALNAINGKRIWHYQTVKHDIWDYDLPCAPTLATIPWQGQPREILIQPTKMGELILLDRNTGYPLLQPEEKKVLSSDVPGEQAFSTQSFNQGIPLVHQGYDTARVTDISEAAKNYVLVQSRKYKFKGMYTPPSLMGTITQPGTRGGMGWSGLSYNPHTYTVFTNCNDFPMLFQLEKLRKPGTSSDPNYEGEKTYMLNCSNCHGVDRKGSIEGYPGLLQLQKKYKKFEIKKIIAQGQGLMPAHTQFSPEILNNLVTYLTSDPVSKNTLKDNIDSVLDRYVLKGFKIFTDLEGFPASKPPWGTLNAVDLITRKILWSVPLGFYPKLKERGLAATGTQNFGGCVATEGGLVFIGATADEMFRAYNANSGKELWAYKLPAGGYATPAVYQIKGKQYVIIAAGGGNRNATSSSDVYVSFALPE